MDKTELLKLFPLEIRDILEEQDITFDKITEIRIRTDKPILIYCGEKEYIIRDKEMVYIPNRKTMKNIMEYISEFSIYAFEEEIRQGFLTLRGGHRVGISGKPVIKDGKIISFQHVTGFNFRIAHEMIGAAEKMVPHLFGGGGIRNTLIISPPGYGKTTMLRDMIRVLSDGSSEQPGMTIGVVDERSELGGSYLGIPQNDLGMRTDLLDACPKSEGMMLLIRSMSPQIIAVDELGGQVDALAVKTCIRCGCKMIATVHGSNLEEISLRDDLRELLSDGVFERFLLLKKSMEGKHYYMLYNQKMQAIGGKQPW